MADGKNATVKILVEVSEEGDAVPMSTTEQVWNGLDRISVLVLEELLLDMFNKTSELGYTAEIAKGRASKEKVDFAKSTVAKLKGNK